MSVYLALHTSAAPTAGDLREIGQYAHLFGAADDTPPSVDVATGEITVVLPLGQIADVIDRYGATR
jgi:hypothetical protein